MLVRKKVRKANPKTDDDDAALVEKWCKASLESERSMLNDILVKNPASRGSRFHPMQQMLIEACADLDKVSLRVLLDHLGKVFFKCLPAVLMNYVKLGCDYAKRDDIDRLPNMEDFFDSRKAMEEQQFQTIQQ